MNRIVAVISLLVLGCPVITLAGPKEDVAAATQTWIAGMTAHDVERVVALYDSEAVLWAPSLPRFVTPLGRFASTSTYCTPCRHPTRLSWVNNVFASMVTSLSARGRTPFRRSATAKKSLVQRGSALSTGIAVDAG